MKNVSLQNVLKLNENLDPRVGRLQTEGVGTYDGPSLALEHSLTTMNNHRIKEINKSPFNLSPKTLTPVWSAASAVQVTEYTDGE